ncbi:MAG: hypothetical protein AB7T63_08205 [Planctomycetota bacterium]
MSTPPPVMPRAAVHVDGVHALRGSKLAQAYAEGRRALARQLPGWREDAARGLAGSLAFLVPGGGEGVAAAVEAYAAAADPRGTLVVAGIGGSALSARCFAALRRRHVRSQELVVLDTADPDVVSRLPAAWHPHGTRLIGVSKSGTTLESMAVFELLETWLTSELGAEGAREAIAVVAGEGPNPLRARAEQAGYPCFDLASKIGGRFSGLTAVGLVPAALSDVDVLALEAGAAAGRGLALADSEANPALELAALQHAAWTTGRTVNVLLPYGERLAPLGPWWTQLLGESLGKVSATGPVGPVPLAARGPADQHSLLQRLLDGPDDTLVVLIEAPIGPPPGDEIGARIHAGLAPIQAACLEGTRHALAARGRPVVTVRLAAADEASVAAFFQVAEMAVVAWAHLLGVDAQGQPAVQAGKDVAAVLLGTREDAALSQAIAERRAKERGGV